MKIFEKLISLSKLTFNFDNRKLKTLLWPSVLQFARFEQSGCKFGPHFWLSAIFWLPAKELNIQT